MPDPENLEQLKSCVEPAFEEFYRIYADSISEREQKSREWICEMVRRSDYKVLVMKRNNQVIALSMIFLPDSEAFGLLEYMAVKDDFRNQGLGGELFRRSMKSALTAKGRSVPVLLEVDSDREECIDRKLRARRQQFYRRLGCLRLAGLHYILPLPGKGSLPQMDLMIYPADNLQSIPKSELERWLEVIYQGVYNCSPGDPRIKQILRDVSDSVRLE